MDAVEEVKSLYDLRWIVHDNILKKKIILLKIPPDDDDPTESPISIFTAHDSTRFEIYMEDVAAIKRFVSFKFSADRSDRRKMKRLQTKILRDLARYHVTLAPGRPNRINNGVFFEEKIRDFYFKQETLLNAGYDLKSDDKRLNNPEEAFKHTCVQFAKKLSINFPIKDDQVGFSVITYEDIIESLENFYNRHRGEWSVVITNYPSSDQKPINRYFCMHRPSDGKVRMSVSYINCTFPRHITPQHFDRMPFDPHATVDRSLEKDEDKDHEVSTMQTFDALPVREIIPLSKYLAPTKSCRKSVLIKLLFIGKRKFLNSLIDPLIEQDWQMNGVEYCDTVLLNANAIFHRHGLMERCIESLLNESDLEAAHSHPIHFTIPGLFGHLRFAFQTPKNSEEERIALCLDGKEHMILVPKVGRLTSGNSVRDRKQLGAQPDPPRKDKLDEFSAVEQFYLKHIFAFMPNYKCAVVRT